MMLVRHLLHQRLAAYYAQSADAVVGSVVATTATTTSSSTHLPAAARPLALSRLWGEWHWKRLYARLYDNNQGQWLTPVELFQPYYSNAIANFIAASLRVDGEKNNNNNDALHTMTSSIPEFDIIELGGGRGTNALHILNHLQQQHSNVYEKLQTYYMIDASPSLHQLQRETLLALKNSSSLSTASFESSPASSQHASKIRLDKKNLVDVAEGRVSLLPSSSLASSSSSPCSQYRPTIVVACEVLDNLPHDKIRITTTTTGTGGGSIRTTTAIQQAEVRSTGDDSDDCLQEVFCPLQDALIQRVIDSSPRLSSAAPINTEGVVVRWIPTVACGVLEQLHQERPNFGLVLADFDWLPPPNLDTNAPTANRRRPRSIPAQDGSEPLVTSMFDIDYPCYLSAVPSPSPSPSQDDDDDDLCDILFPTDFDFLAKFIQNQQQQQSSQRDSIYNNNNNAQQSQYNNTAHVVQVQVQKQADFLKEYGPEQVEQTKSWLTGYSPMVDDFVNCSVLTMRPPKNIIPKQQ